MDLTNPIVQRDVNNAIHISLLNPSFHEAGRVAIAGLASQYRPSTMDPHKNRRFAVLAEDLFRSHDVDVQTILALRNGWSDWTTELLQCKPRWDTLRTGLGYRATILDLSGVLGRPGRSPAETANRRRGVSDIGEVDVSAGFLFE
jgi:hypothetical protein